MRLSRRDLLRTGAAAGAAATTAAATTGGATAASATPAGPSAGPLGRAVPLVGSLASRFTTGAPGARGYRPVISVAGEAHVARTELAAAAPGRAAVRSGLFGFVQLSDIHIVDAQSPMRVEWLDRLEDETSLPTLGLLSSSYRPQEILSGQISDSMVKAINDIAVGPVTGRPLALAIQTGDNSDNSQRNEIRWNIDVLDGGTVRVDSGNLTRYEGVADNHPLSYDPHYWHPHGTPPGKVEDFPRRQYGFPVVPGLLDAARRPFEAVGLQMPWYSVFGNHDGLVQGNFPGKLGFDAVARGSLKIMSPPLGLHPGRLLDKLLKDPVGLLSTLAVTGGARIVARDGNRKLLTRKQVIEEHFTTTGTPVGHGFTEANRTKGTAYYSFDQGPCRFVVIDTVNPNGYADGSIDRAQFDWLAGVLADSADRLVMVFSHHTSSTMSNPLVGTGGDLSPRVLGGEVLDLLLAHPQVIAWINGHTHTNTVVPRTRADGGGLWEITTASHIDWPQQARLIEITDNADGTLSIFTTMVDHTGPASAGAGTGDARQLAGLARELAANDWHPHGHGEGTALDRNVELLIADPRV